MLAAIRRRQAAQHCLKVRVGAARLWSGRPESIHQDAAGTVAAERTNR